MYTQEQVNQTRTMLQNVAYRAWENAGRKGTIAAATGFGKSYLAVKRATELCTEWYDSGKLLSKPDILLVTPTEKLRDENWPAEFRKWGFSHDLTMVKRICFASLKNEKGNKYKLVILDEAHRITSYNAEGFLKDGSLTQFFAENMAEEVMALTATEPDKDRDMTKYSILDQIAPICFKYTLDQGVADGLVPPYEIRVILVPLDNVTKNIPGGSKKNGTFLTTEASAYEYLNKQCKKAFGTKKQGFIQAMTGKRAAFIRDLPSKTRVAKKVLEKVLPGKRTLVFCGGIEQSRQLCGENVYNSSPEDKPRGMLTAFKNQQIDYLGVVNAVNEGHNIDEMDQAVIVQLSSNERDLTQRVGRCLRYREGHKPMIYILVAQGTQDQSWASDALQNFDPKRIVYDSYLNYMVTK